MTGSPIEGVHNKNKMHKNTSNFQTINAECDEMSGYLFTFIVRVQMHFFFSFLIADMKSFHICTHRLG